MPEAMRCGVVGAGRAFEKIYMPCIAERPELVLVAACDVNITQARSVLSEEVSCETVTDDLGEFFDAGLDVVIVSSPNDSHFDPVLRAIGNGASVMCEKPLTSSIERSRMLTDAAADASLAAVNLPYRFHDLIPPFRATLPADGCEVSLVFTTPGVRLWRPASGWYGDPLRSGGGALTDLGPHIMDLLTAALGFLPVPVSCEVDDHSMEERSLINLTAGPFAVRVELDRRSRRTSLVLETDLGPESVSLDFRRGLLQRPGDVVVTSHDRRPETAAVSRFLDAASGGVGDTVSFEDSLRFEEIVASLRSSATIFG